MEFSQQEYWSGLPFPFPRDLPDPGIEPVSPRLLLWQVDSLPLSHQGRPLHLFHMLIQWGFPGGTRVTDSPVSAGDTGDAGSIPGSERSPGGGNGNPLQCSCWENSMDRGAWQATDHGVAESDTMLI